jgi:nucleotide-binding universal stress UspA family protein
MGARVFDGHAGPMTVLVGYNPQTLDRAPVRFAAAAARFADVPLVVASVLAGITQAARARDDLGEERECLRVELTNDRDIDVRPRVVQSSTPAGVARGLQRAIEEEHASLAVIGSSRRGVIGHVAPGTTAQQVINGCGCPVVVVPHGHDPRGQLAKVGVAFVPTPEGRGALRAAAAVARMTGADLRVLTVVKPTLGADATAGPAREAAERTRAELEATVAAAIAELADGVPARSEVFVDDPADALVRVSPHLDLLVMGSRGYGPARAVLLGGVSRRLTAKARCPLLVVPRGSALALRGHAEMATACTTYPDEAGARHAVQALTAAGVPSRDIRLLIGHRPHDIRREAVGGFAGPVDLSAHVGTYAGAVRLRRQGAGGFAGDPDQQRQGSYGDSDAIVVEAGGGRPRIAGHLELKRLLQRAALADDATEGVIGELDTGHAVVLVEAADIADGERGRRLEEMARAA